MINSLVLDKTLEKLVSFCLTKGVQPDELITAIFEHEYNHVESSKVDDFVIFTISYQDQVNDEIFSVKMRYTYNKNKYLQLIEQKIDGKQYKVQWDRSKKIDSIINELVSKYEVVNDVKLQEKIKSKIPEELIGYLYPKLKLVA